MRVPTLLLILLSAFAATDIYATTWTVTNIDVSNDGVCDDNCSLPEAIGATANGDTVVFSPLFNSPQTIYFYFGEINIQHSITINGPGRSLLTLSGGGISFGRIFRLASGISVTLRDMKIANGCACGWEEDGIQPYGGAIYNQAQSLRLENMSFRDNYAYTRSRPYGDFWMGYGGAIYGGNQVTVINCEFVNNFGFRDGTAIIAWIIDITDSQFDANPGGYTVSGHQVTVDNSTFSNSREDWIYSGAIGSGYSVSAYNSTFTNNGNAITSGGQLYVENCVLNNNGEYRYAIQTGPQSVGIIKNTIIANNLEFGWGGVGNTEGTLSIINSTITGNILGVITEGGNLFVTNSTVSGNNYPYPSNQYGAGIYSKPTYNGIGAQVVVTNSTIVNNNATWEGGGIRNSFNCSLTLRNSIVAGNTASDDSSDIFGTVISEGNNLIGNTTGSTGWIASDLLNVNPLLGSLANNGGPSMTHALLNGSPAIDAGNNSLAVDPQTQMFLSSDQRGFPRLVGVAVDIGAYESTQTSSPVIAGTVTYGNSSGLPRFVSGVLINAITSPNVFATTLGAGSGQGTYLLTGFGSGSQTVTATKTGGVNGISSFDAGLIALHVAGITPLTGNQLLVTDTSGNGTVSSFDAGQVASYAAAVPGSGSTGNWIFIPANRYYPSVTSNITGEHFVALLMGEVSGNWTDGQNHRR